MDSGGNAGLPGRQALHTQASSATLSQQPHPPREVDATWHLPPVFNSETFRQYAWNHADTGVGKIIAAVAPTEGIWWDGWRQDCKNNTEFLIDELRGWRSAGQRLTLDPLAAIGIRRNSLECVQGSGVKRLSESDAEYFERGTVRRTCFREWRKGYNAAT